MWLCSTQIQISPLLGFFGIGSPGAGEMVVILIVAVVLFGGRLPEVARSFGSYYQQFRKGLSDIQTSIKNEVDVNELKSLTKLPEFHDIEDDYDVPTAPKMVPPDDEG